MKPSSAIAWALRLSTSEVMAHPFAGRVLGRRQPIGSGAQPVYLPPPLLPASMASSAFSMPNDPTPGSAIGAEIPHADVVAHDDNDVRLLLLRLIGHRDSFECLQRCP